MLCVLKRTVSMRQYVVCTQKNWINVKTYVKNDVKEHILKYIYAKMCVYLDLWSLMQYRVFTICGSWQQICTESIISLCIYHLWVLTTDLYRIYKIIVYLPSVGPGNRSVQNL